MIRATLYTKTECPLCDEARRQLQSLQSEYPHDLFSIDIDLDPALQARYANAVPVVQIGPYTLKAPFTAVDLKVALAAAQQGGLPAPVSGAARSQVVRIDRAVLFVARHWLALLNLVIGLYVGLPFLAPVLMQAGATRPAHWIYLAYRPLCHQAAFRSWFLFGDQPAYPRAIAGTDLISYEAYTGLDPNDIVAAREFIGNDQAGFKVALCQRDVAIYGAILLGGLVFALVRKRLKPLPLLLWLLLGVVPLGIDGSIQLFSALPFWPFPYYESTPLVRTVSGALFGLANVWMAYPYLDESMTETAMALIPKLARVDIERRGTRVS